MVKVQLAVGGIAIEHFDNPPKRHHAFIRKTVLSEIPQDCSQVDAGMPRRLPLHASPRPCVQPYMP